MKTILKYITLISALTYVAMSVHAGTFNILVMGRESRYIYSGIWLMLCIIVIFIVSAEANSSKNNPQK